MAKKIKAFLRVILLKRHPFSVANFYIRGLKEEEGVWKEFKITRGSQGKIIESLHKAALRELKHRIEEGVKTDIIEVEAETTGAIASEGEVRYKLSNPLLLYPRPVSLLRIGVVPKDGCVKQDGGGVSCGSSIQWFNIDDDVYIYETIPRLPGPWKMLLLETTEGVRIIMKNEVRDAITGYNARRWRNSD